MQHPSGHYIPYATFAVSAEGDVEADKIEDYGDVIEAMLMLGVHSEIAANEETVEASAKYIFGDEDVRKSTMK